MRRFSSASKRSRCAALTRRVSTCTGASCGSFMTCSTRATASSRALSVPCPKYTRARFMRRVALAIRSPTLMWNNRAMSNRYWISVAAIAAAAALAGVYVARMLSLPAVPSLESGTSFPRPRPLADFNLVDTHGAPAPAAALRGHPTLVFFGFTHCPDVCPTTLALLASVQKQVAQPGLKVALISVDPERDSPEQLGRYIASFGGDLIGLTGPAPEIVKTMKSLRRGGGPCRSSGWQLHHGPFGHDFRARLRRPDRRGVHAAVQCRRAHARCREARAGVVGRSRFMSEAVPAPAAARSSRFSTCCRNTASRGWCSPRRARARPPSRTR